MGDDNEIDRLIARKLQQLRTDRGLTLTHLAELTGISVAHLSRLERGERQPSIGSLLQLARTYGISIGKLVSDQPDEEYHLVRAGQAVAHETAEGRYEVLSGPRATIAVVGLELPPGTKTGAVHHTGEEWLHVRSGAVVLHLGDEELALKSGDSVQFDSGRTHRVHNASARAARVLIASTAAAVHHPVTGAENR
ncbi:cupin domain-containing protein [Amycolatopsis rhabdoformis]|uniref:Cupin domain-containing protein n=1 Tax=Amycolatopsis rhabdoformis TaxID=1448059 RepID=A0ABZ1HXF7_9PSEU|nr:cupin domain-containing protein [Amycolatopsis rhabdoformis]WSE26237.1 cupin domain-containing protein [Amycolatopsis rhabdoformis]